MKVSMKFLITLALTAGSIYLVFVLNEEGPFRILFNLLTFAGIYGLAAIGLNVHFGLTGLLNFGHASFMGVGAYVTLLLIPHAAGREGEITDTGLAFFPALIIGIIAAALFGLLLGLPAIRLRGDYLAIVTLAFGEMIRILLLNWYELTKGPDGLTGIPRPSFFGLPFKRYPDEGVETFHTFFGLEYDPMQRIIFLYYLILVLALITNAFTIKIRRLPVGRAWEALREDEIACKSLGVNPRNTKLTAFAVGAMFGGFAGSFFATRQAFISPESFTFIESAIIVAIVVLGGMGSQTGVVLSTIFLIGLIEVFRDFESYRMVAFGGAMVLIMVFRPRGILAKRKPTIIMGKHG